MSSPREAPSPNLRKAGALALFTAVATLVAVAGRVAADADQPTLAESLNAIAESRLEYSIGWIARIVSGGALAAAAYMVWRRGPGGNARDLRPMLAMFALSGACTALSGVSSALLTAMAPAVGAAAAEPGTAQEVVDVLRWFFGKAGFAASGLALIAAARPLFGAGVPWRIAALATFLLGGAMLFIWWDAATTLHRITGPAFIVWLVIAGGLTVAGRGGRALAVESAAS